MDNKTIHPTTLTGAFRIERPTFPDDRGFFRETVRKSELEAVLGYSFNIMQMSHAHSTKNILRGIHVATEWNKLIYVARGKVQSVIVDLHEDSPTFGKYESFILGEENPSSLFIPKGYGNSYLVLSDVVDYMYLTDKEWEPNKEYGVMWNDPTLAVSWQLAGDPILSERDKNNKSFKELFPEKRG